MSWLDPKLFMLNKLICESIRESLILRSVNEKVLVVGATFRNVPTLNNEIVVPVMVTS